MKDFVIDFSGELYHGKKDKSDEKIVLDMYKERGIEAFNMLNGVYSFAIWDNKAKELVLVRDRLGIKSLFYTFKDGYLVFSRKIKDLLKFPGVSPVIDKEGLCEILALGPGRTQGSAVFKNVKEIKAGYYVVYSAKGFYEKQYWDLPVYKHTDNYEQTVKKTKELLLDSLERQSLPNPGLCSLISGGIDSSTVTSFVCKNQKDPLKTFSFDYIDNDKYFKSSSFQPQQDRPWVEKIVDEFNTKQDFLLCDSKNLVDYLYKSVDIKDLPGMGDIDSSLLYFCEEVAKSGYRIALTGECGDEVFGGYPWFYREEYQDAKTFPWSLDLSLRKFIFNEYTWQKINAEEYVQNRYNETISSVKSLDDDTKETKRKREISYLNLKWFMVTLLYRMEKASEATGIAARVPFADYKLVEYVFNIPWEYKYQNQIEKSLLRAVATDLVPEEILYRKKSPFPKTYNPEYEKLLREEVRKILDSKIEPVIQLIDVDNVRKFVDEPKDYGKPWFGQLMAGPQMLAYIIQLNYWLKKYKVEIFL